MPDVLALSADFSLEVLLRMPQVTVGSVMRAADVFRLVRSSTLNLARALGELERNVEIGGFLAGTNGKFFQQQLERKGLRGHFVWCEGETPQNLIVTEQDGRTTDLNEQSLQVDLAHFHELAEQIKSIHRQFTWVSLSGKIPPGVSPDSYADLLESARSTKIAVGVYRDGLAVFARHNLDLLCINALEASSLLGWHIVTPDDARRACQELRSWGNVLVVIDLYRHGAVGCNEQGCWHASLPKMIGSRSGQLASMLDGLIANESLDNILRRSVAACDLPEGFSNRISQVVLKQLA